MSQDPAVSSNDHSRPVPRADLVININEFRPLGGVMPIDYSMCMLNAPDRSNPFSFKANTLYINWGKIPQSKVVQVCFSLVENIKESSEARMGLGGLGFDTRHLFVGMAFSGRRNHSSYRGQNEFPRIEIDSVKLQVTHLLDENFGTNKDCVQKGVSRQLTVYVQHIPAFDHTDFNYVLLVQSAKTGEIGIIDPGIESDSGQG